MSIAKADPLIVVGAVVAGAGEGNLSLYPDGSADVLSEQVVADHDDSLKYVVSLAAQDGWEIGSQHIRHHFFEVHQIGMSMSGSVRSLTLSRALSAYRRSSRSFFSFQSL